MQPQNEEVALMPILWHDQCGHYKCMEHIQQQQGRTTGKQASPASLHARPGGTAGYTLGQKAHDHTRHSTKRATGHKDSGKHQCLSTHRCTSLTKAQEMFKMHDERKQEDSNCVQRLSVTGVWRPIHIPSV